MSDAGQRWFAVAGLALGMALALVALGVWRWAAVGLLVVAAALAWRGLTQTRNARERLEARTRQAEAEAGAMHASAERLGTYLQLLDEPVLVCDERQSVSLVNEAARQWLDMAAGDLIGRSIDEVFTNAEVLSLHARAARGEGCRRRVTIAGENGYRVADVSAVPVPPAEGASERGSGVILVLRDVTELSRVLQIRTDFAANASHELRTPIAALRGAVDTLNGRASRDEAMRTRLLSMLDENVTRLEDLIRDLLDLSRLEALEGAVRLSLVPASEMVRVLERAFEPMCERGGVTLRFEFDPALERLRSDRNLLTMILRNLIENAIKFSEAGDEVIVRGAVEAVEGEARGTCVIEVIDHGQGIPLPMQQRIFERFYQVDTSRDGSKVARGTGLGLAIVKHAVRTLGGVIKVKSVWQRGTTMTVELPGAVPAAARAPGGSDDAA
jgi:two-component system phosphate regulon sensor histidine kinase PhoR